MNRRGFLGLLFAAPVVGPSLIRGMSVVAQKVAPKSVTAQELLDFINAHIAKTAVTLEEIKAGATAMLANTRKIGDRNYTEDMHMMSELLNKEKKL